MSSRKRFRRKPKNNFYVVKTNQGKGWCGAIYESWDDASLAIKNRPKGKLLQKGFVTKEEASAYLGTVSTPATSVTQQPLPIQIVTEVYTDGGCRDNGTLYARAGVGVYFGENRRNISIPLPGKKQSNNRAELLAAILGVIGVDDHAKSVVYTDSKYVIDAFQGPVPKSTTANRDLIIILMAAKDMRPNTKLVHVKAHNGNVGNEAADKLATAGIGDG